MGRRVVVVGSGVAGLAAAHSLARAGAHVTLYEKDRHFGGHAWTQHVDGTPVDVGFMVFNRVTYPNMVEFFEEEGVEMEASNMSFAVSLNEGKGVEWGSNGLAGLFAQKRNALNPSFLYMIREMVVFQNDVLRYLDGLKTGEVVADATETLGSFLDHHGYSKKFREWYLVPVCGSIWSCSNETVLQFSAFSVLSFLRNHHMLQLLGRPEWLTVKGRSHKYVEKIVADLERAGATLKINRAIASVANSASGAVVVTDELGVAEEFESCVIAAHAPDALTLLGYDATPDEERILGAFKYSSSDIYLHRDANMMPRRQAAWSAWNFLGSKDGVLSVTYWLNLLQNLGDTGGLPILVTLNPTHRPAKVVSQWQTSHPIPSPEAAAAARQMTSIQGRRGIWFCGAYQGYGFHEDGFKAGMEAAASLLGVAAAVKANVPQMSLSWPESLARQAVIAFLRDFIHIGHLQLLEAGGTVLDFGTPIPEGSKPPAGYRTCKLRILHPAFYWKVATRVDLGLADSFVDGDFTCVRDGLLDFLLLLIANRDRGRVPGRPRNSGKGWWSPAMLTAVLGSAVMYVRHLFRSNTLTNARRNISNHYDLSNDMFATFLDETMTYSCAIFKTPDEPLKEAQFRKLHALIDKAKIEPHHHVLEIGFGWGSLSMEMVRRTGCRVTGITLSKQQMALAQERVNAAGLQDKIDFKLCDYRSLPGVGAYDRILSCEMLEAVGHEYYGDFFASCDRLLKMDGLLVVQVITTPEERYEEYRRSSDFIKEYIFPGCCVPSLAALVAAMAASSSFSIENVQNIGPHYAPTLLRWRDAFLAHREEILKFGFGEKFIRMWDYYFVYCAAGFETCTLGDIQVVFTRSGNQATLGDLSSCYM